MFLNYNMVISMQMSGKIAIVRGLYYVFIMRK